MKLNLLTQTFLGLGMLSAASLTFALEAWNGQEGADNFEVIFADNVYTNAWWVGGDQCPKDAVSDEDINPWRLVRAATEAETAKYGNPTACTLSEPAAEYPDFEGTKSYSLNDIIKYNSGFYKATANIAANSFAPGDTNPWKLYKEVPNWSSGQTYLKGDEVQVNGQAFVSLFWNQGTDPSNPENQELTGTSGKPWKLLGAVKSYSQEELSNAPNIDVNQLYVIDELVSFNGNAYVAQQSVQKVVPTDSNPWKVFIDWKGTKERVGTPKNQWPKHVYAPYVDFTLYNIPDLAKLAKEQNINHFTMAFVVAKDADTCLPTWGAAYDLQTYPQYQKIKELRDAGGDIMLSIGGANNYPLAAACKNSEDLSQMYYEIVDNLNLNVLDFDIEGTWVADQESIERRNVAVKAVQDKWKQEGRNIDVWYTLPILPTGLTGEGLNVLNDAKAKGVVLSGVNVMTMDYGNSVCQSTGTEGQNIHGTCATSAIDNMFDQIKTIYPEKSDKEINAMMGTTAMIGYNDVQGETFYLSDANLVYQHAKDRALGMVSIWSMMRDRPGIFGQVSPEHSGLTASQADEYAFSKVFSPFTQHVETETESNLAILDINSNYANGHALTLILPEGEFKAQKRYMVKVNGSYVFETYEGKSYYSSNSVKNGVVTVAFNKALNEGDVVSLYLVEGKPGQSYSNSTLKSETTVLARQDVSNPADNAVKSITNSGNTIKVTLDDNLFKEQNRYIVRVNGKYAMETHMGKAYYSSISKNADTVTIQRTWGVDSGDIITVVRAAWAPGSSSDIYTEIGTYTVK
ncbi:glycosyl hydrolase family 18 protein [Yersinia enterocolitica]|uniref:glycosyl hydrolase family 18 protein n=1 Tax=Yersinia enterocolitica TaxID=630 RepID=UPI001C8D6DFD|nr:glycosyl hydrolase family 18 protein [Yersinia enterocolitica]EKN4180469.1 lysozyme [Yersinia enterocolitica]MBX9487352.1 lysozyme [Yersinia enterocolitica]MBX9490736.1 lysozyme [Yersinia enterocolitica]HEN3447386.1 lysozyme [Yersinia enterocolitica]